MKPNEPNDVNEKIMFLFEKISRGEDISKYATPKFHREIMNLLREKGMTSIGIQRVNMMGINNPEKILNHEDLIPIAEKIAREEIQDEK